MGSYFKPLRRKIGVVTLLTACVFAAGWIRSQVVADELRINHDKDSDTSLQSANGFLVWWSFHETDRNINSTVRFFRLRSFKDVGSYFHDDPKDRTSWRFRITGFGYGGIPTNGYGNPSLIRVAFVSYCYVTVPVTLLSAWLLLSQPRAPKPVPPIAENA